MPRDEPQRFTTELEPEPLTSRSRSSFAARTAAFLGTWSALVTLGLLPSAAVVIAVIADRAGHASSEILWAVVALSALVSLILGVVAARAIRHSLALETDMRLIGEMFRAPKPQRTPWLPEADGSLPITNAVLELAYERALDAAHASVGDDAELGVAWVSLSDPMVAFNTFSPIAQKEARVWAVPDGVNVLDIRRAAGPRYPIGPPQWRRDTSWRELVLRSWAQESPFKGSVMLWPRWHASDGRHEGGDWRIEYRPELEGVSGPPRSYTIGKDGKLLSHS